MPCNISWHDDDHSIIIYDCRNPWDWSEVLDYNAQVYDMVESVQHEVHFIVLATGKGRLPMQILNRAQMLARDLHPRTGMFVVVNADSRIYMVFRVLQRVGLPLMGKVRFAATLSEAERLLAKQPV